MISYSHWGMVGDPVAQPMTCHGQPVYGDVLWWVTDDKSLADCQSRFPNVLHFQGDPVFLPRAPEVS